MLNKALPLVIHRIGGLEDLESIVSLVKSVIHRIGGLEGQESAGSIVVPVIHRIGGLEGRWHPFPFAL